MKIYITADTTLEKVGVDYLEFSTPLGDILVDADEISSYVEDRVMHSQMKGVYFNDEYANGMAAELVNGTLVRIHLYTPESVEKTDIVKDAKHFRIKTITVDDSGEMVSVIVQKNPEILTSE